MPKAFQRIATSKTKQWSKPRSATHGTSDRRVRAGPGAGRICRPRTPAAPAQGRRALRTSQSQNTACCFADGSQTWHVPAVPPFLVVIPGEVSATTESGKLYVVPPKVSTLLTFCCREHRRIRGMSAHGRKGQHRCAHQGRASGARGELVCSGRGVTHKLSELAHGGEPGPRARGAGEQGGQRRGRTATEKGHSCPLRKTTFLLSSRRAHSHIFW